MSYGVGDVVRIRQTKDGSGALWPEAEGQVGVIIALAKRLYIPAAKVMVIGQVAEFDEDELEKVDNV
jgi:hypothetical protein